jgi:cytochrome c peroxidase
MKSRYVLLGFFSLPFVGLVLGSFLAGSPVSDEEPLRPIIGNVRTIEAAYARWQAENEKHGQNAKLVLALGYFKGLSSEFTQAAGRAMLDLTDGSLAVEVVGLPEGREFAVWLVHNRPGIGRSVKPEPGDHMIQVGKLVRDGDHGNLQTSLDLESLAGFKLDLLVVVPEGRDPTDGGLIFGLPNVFQKLFYAAAAAGNLISPKASDPDGTSNAAALVLAPFRSLIPTLAYADKGGAPHFAELVARGEKLFFEEKFQGNGRTCGTCHPAENNFTIDPAFIATRPKNDPLFVAEFNKDLNSDTNGGRRFEIPQLMRQFGLILENVDGFEDLTTRYVMRGTPHTLAQALSITPAAFDGTSPLVLQRTGWGGDGAPGTGTLREFAIGAVTQHFTRTLNRAAGVDFRLPTDGELDAIEAFLLSLGRQAELNLSDLGSKLKDDDVKGGLTIFNNEGKCALCHFNAGANHGISVLPGIGVQNANFNTGVENAPHPAGPHGSLRPRDGGFGRDVDDGFGGFGIGTFNTPLLVEAADKRTFFHNNLCNRIECAVEFYNSDAFNDSPAGAVAPISLGQDKVFQVAAFLRAINTLENIRAATAKLENAQASIEMHSFALPRLRKLLELASVDIQDAYRVLDEGKDLQFKSEGLHPEARTLLEYAKENCEIAYKGQSKAQRYYRISEALNALAAATREIVQE